MIDIKQIREAPERYKKAAVDKHIAADIDQLLAVDKTLGDARRQLQDISTDKNRIGKSIPKLAPADKQNALAELAQLKEREARFNAQVKELGPQFTALSLMTQDTPTKVVINEAVELAKRFGTAEAPAFVNGILVRIAQGLRPTQT
jgi:seryl-tRNA synthetase